MFENACANSAAHDFMALLEHEFIAMSKLYEKKQGLLTYVSKVHVQFHKKEIDLYLKKESRISQQSTIFMFWKCTLKEKGSKFIHSPENTCTKTIDVLRAHVLKQKTSIFIYFSKEDTRTKSNEIKLIEKTNVQNTKGSNLIYVIQMQDLSQA